MLELYVIHLLSLIMMMISMELIKIFLNFNEYVINNNKNFYVLKVK
jgi:hypothetical protein